MQSVNTTDLIKKARKSNMIDETWLLKAIETIHSGIADKLQKDNITVYRVKSIIRVDVKESEEK